MTNAIAAAAKSAARTMKIRQSYGRKIGQEAKAEARKKAISSYYKKQAQEKILANWVAEKVKARYAGKKRSTRTPASAEVVAG